MKLQYIVRRYTSEVELFKNAQCPLGISIAGSRKDRGRPIITNIKQGSVAHKSFCLSEGDVILSIRGFDTRGMSKKDVKRSFKDSYPRLIIKVEYTAREACLGYCRVYRTQKMSLTLKKANGTFGFVLRKNSELMEYPVISNIRHGSPAGSEANIMDGDRLLAVDGQSLSWIPLTDIANLLKDKEEATFHIEYNVGIVDLSKEKETHLEIACPDADLGMTVSNDGSSMTISFIQPGSLAQRCGFFHVGEEILSINGVDAKAMSSAKANYLLSRFKKGTGNITFISKDESPKLESSVSRPKIKDPSSPLSPTFVPPNSYASSYYNPIPEDVFFKSLENSKQHNDYQLEIMSMLSELQISIDNIALGLSNENLDANSSNKNNDNCKSGKNRELMTLKGLIQQHTKLMHNLTIYVIKNSAQMKHNMLAEVQQKNGFCINDKIKIEFIDSLNEFVNRKLVSKNSARKLIAAAVDVNKNCLVCFNEFYTAAFAVRKAYLMLCLNNITQQEIATIRHTLKRVSQLAFLCCDCKKPSNSLSTSATESARKVGESSIPQRTFGTSNGSAESTRIPRCGTYSIRGFQMKCEPRVGINLSQQTVMYRHDHVSSKATNSDTFRSSDTLHTGQVDDSPQRRSSTLTPPSQYTSTVTSLTEADRQRVISDQDSQSQISDRQKNAFERHSTPLPNTSFNKPLCQGKSSTGFDVVKEHHPTSEAGPSHGIDGNPSKNTSHKNSIRSHTDAQEVLLKTENGGFGFILGYSSTAAIDENRVPIISAIKPSSAAHRCGLLKKGDRILALNGFSTVGISIGDLESLKKEVFDFDEVVLTVEFDVTEAGDTWGTFTIELEAGLKLGLVMDEPDYPSFVRGIIRGSSAHRSGQLFPGDEILSFSTRNEEALNLQTWTMRKTKIHRITVHRERDSESYKREASRRRFQLPLDPASFARSGSLFNIKRTSIRTLEGLGGREKMILEQEFTLFRDPLQWDFGFLFGENPQTGHAYVTDIRAGGPADSSKIVKKYDRIMEVNGVLVDNTVESSIMSLFMQTDDRVNLVTRRVLHNR